jgi:cell division protein FtsQ
MAQHHYSFPVVTGIDSRDPIAGRRARMEVYQRLLNQLDSGGQHLSDQISEIDLRDPEDARVLMPEQGTDILAHFGEDHFLERFQRYKAHIAEWRQQYPKLAEVDLRYDQQVVLQMTDGARPTQAQMSQLQEPSTAVEPPKPSPSKPEVKPATLKAEPPRHAQPVKAKKAQAAKSATKSSKSKHARSKTAAKKPAKHSTKKSTAKPHRTTTRGE